MWCLAASLWQLASLPDSTPRIRAIPCADSSLRGRGAHNLRPSGRGPADGRPLLRLWGARGPPCPLRGRLATGGPSDRKTGAGAASSSWPLARRAVGHQLGAQDVGGAGDAEFGRRIACSWKLVVRSCRAIEARVCERMQRFGVLGQIADMRRGAAFRSESRSAPATDPRPRSWETAARAPASGRPWPQAASSTASPNDLASRGESPSEAVSAASAEAATMIRNMRGTESGRNQAKRGPSV